MEVLLGTLRPSYSKVAATLAPAAYSSDTNKLRDGDKYDYYIDGITVVVDDLSTAKASKVLIDFAILPTGGVREDLLASFPYSLRGTRNNPNYIPLTKTSRTNEMPFLPKTSQFYFKILNNDAVATISGVAIAVWAYPVLGGL